MPPNSTPTPKTNASPVLQDVVKRLKDATNILITVSANPSVDQLAACIGLTVALNKKDKHATAVFSGEVPSTLEFLEPGKTIEKNTDSLRDFIISLDKNKADKLRYKVDNDANVVRIFITPYRTSISDKDLDFSQGDFNVDVVIALGVHEKNELDEAIIAHGRILHDATVVSVNVGSGAELGSMHWNEPTASSLSEMVADLLKAMDVKVFDEAIATALLTGIVAETDRFRNEKSSPHTMSTSGLLMSAGASTQLVSSQLETPPEPEPEPEVEAEPEYIAEPEVQDEIVEDDSAEPEEVEPPAKTEDDGAFHISHDDDILIDDAGKLAKVADILKEEEENAAQAAQAAEAANSQAEAELPPLQPLETPTTPDVSPPIDDQPSAEAATGPSMIYEPPAFGGQLTANTDLVDQQYVNAPDALTAPANESDRPVLGRPHEKGGMTIQPPATDQTLQAIEQSIGSPHAAEYSAPPSVEGSDLPPLEAAGPAVEPADENYARDAVQRAVQAAQDYRPEPLQSIGSSPLGDPLNPAPPLPEQNDSPSGPPPPPVPPPLPPFGQ